MWADVFLDSPDPHIVVRAKNAKNRKLQPLPLHPEVGIFPKTETFRHDLMQHSTVTLTTKTYISSASLPLPRQ